MKPQECDTPVPVIVSRGEHPVYTNNIQITIHIYIYNLNIDTCHLSSIYMYIHMSLCTYLICMLIYIWIYATNVLPSLLSGILQITGKGLQKATERQAEVNGGAVRLDGDV